MAGGWARDGAVQDQIDASVADAVKAVRESLPTGQSREFCEECGVPIPVARQRAVVGVQYCVTCQSELETVVNSSAVNRRASKDSQLK